MRKILISFLMLLILLPLDYAEAAEIIYLNDHGNVYGNYSYDSGRNTMRLGFTGSSVKRVEYQYYSDNNFSSMGQSREVFAPSGNWLNAVHMTCVGGYDVKAYSDSNLLLDLRILITNSDIPNPKCADEKEEEDNGPNCDICAALKEIRSSLNANNNKLDSIINKIPSPPNWQEVADTMSNTIVPQLVGDTKVMLDDLLGRAPEPPSAPPQPAPPEDLGMPNTDAMPSEPKVDLPPEKDDNSFTASDVIEEAEELEYIEPDEEDSGFNLTIDPFEQLENPGSPGEPKEPEDPGNPGIPKDPDVEESPGTPNQEVEAPPKPNNPEFNPGSPGSPNGDIGSPGKPNEGDYSPSNPGGDIGTPPEHYDPK